MDKINQFRDCGYELIAFLTTLFKQQFPGLAVMAYQCRNYGDVDRIKGAAADALVKHGLRGSACDEPFGRESRVE
jgi:hypothetical protein